MAVAAGLLSSTTLDRVRPPPQREGHPAPTQPMVAIVHCSGRDAGRNVTIDAKMSILQGIGRGQAAVHSRGLGGCLASLCAHSRTGVLTSSVAWPLPLSPDRCHVAPRPRSPRARCLSAATRAYALAGLKERNRRAKVSDDVFAACNRLRAMPQLEHIASVYAGSTGYLLALSAFSVLRDPQHAVSTGRPGCEQRLMTAAITFATRAASVWRYFMTARRDWLRTWLVVTALGGRDELVIRQARTLGRSSSEQWSRATHWRGFLPTNDGTRSRFPTGSLRPRGWRFATCPSLAELGLRRRLSLCAALGSDALPLMRTRPCPQGGADASNEALRVKPRPPPGGSLAEDIVGM